MEMDKPLCGKTEREFLAAGSPGGTGKIRELPVVTAMPEPEIPLGESTRVERLIFEPPLT